MDKTQSNFENQRLKIISDLSYFNILRFNSNFQKSLLTAQSNEAIYQPTQKHFSFGDRPLAANNFDSRHIIILAIILYIQKILECTMFNSMKSKNKL